MPIFKPSPVCLVPAFSGSMPAMALSVVLLPDDSSALACHQMRQGRCLHCNSGLATAKQHFDSQHSTYYCYLHPTQNAALQFNFSKTLTIIAQDIITAVAVAAVLHVNDMQ
eukprot:6842-Heterococcus_DN1.PRE.6